MLLALVGCDAVGTGSQGETFAAADRPAFLQDPVEDFKLLKPWNYDKPWNAARRYPLVVALHGAGGSAYTPCIVGDHRQMQAYPCFYLAPHTTAGTWGSVSDWVFSLVARLKADYRVDPDRIYLIGFSMGGSGSYQVANAFWDQGKVLFAGIIRAAGASETVLRDPIADQTAVWYHIGLDDDAARVKVAADAFAFLRTWRGNQMAATGMTDDRVGGYARRTFSVVRAGHSVALKSEYTGLGHDDGPVYQDPAVLAWLFRQTLGTK